LICV